MIVGQSSNFTSCYWHFNLYTAIFYQYVRSMNSKEWLQKFYAFNFFLPNAFNFDLHKIKRAFCELYRETFLHEVCVKRVCKSCICKHSDKHLPDHNWNLQRCNLRKHIASRLTALNTFLQIWNSSEAFERRKCLWDGCTHEPFLSWTPNFCCLHYKATVFVCCIPCFVVRKLKANFFGIEAIVGFWTINKRKLSLMSSKGIPICIAVFHFHVKSDENLNNSMNTWILNDSWNKVTHLNWHEVVMLGKLTDTLECFLLWTQLWTSAESTLANSYEKCFKLN